MNLRGFWESRFPIDLWLASCTSKAKRHSNGLTYPVCNSSAGTIITLTREPFVKLVSLMSAVIYAWLVIRTIQRWRFGTFECLSDAVKHECEMVDI